MIHERLAAATFAVFDLETTGLDPLADRIVEIACVRVRGGVVLERFATLVDPERDIPARATAVHGIVASDVAGKPTFARLAGVLRAFARDAIVVAHNARFDLAFLPSLGSRPSICTMELARRLVDAPSYRNETLLRFLELQLALPAGRAHRAAADCEVTAALLGDLLARFERVHPEATVATLLGFLARPQRLDRFPFGRHRGKDVASIPTSYLRWIERSDFENWPDVRHTARVELAVREGAA